jgi:hypothetical protein
MFEHEYPFDPTYGYDESALLQVGLPDAPDDFASCWRATFDANSNTHLDTVVTSVDSPHADYKLSVAELDTLGGYRVGAWVVYPKAGDIDTGFVTSHGYGGRTDPDFALFAENAVAIYPRVPGFNLSATDAPTVRKNGARLSTASKTARPMRSDRASHPSGPPHHSSSSCSLTQSSNSAFPVAVLGAVSPHLPSRGTADSPEHS